MTVNDRLNQIRGGNALKDFIFNVPKWQGELVFSEELIVFLLIILLVIVGVLFCFWGYKYFQTSCFLGIAGGLCHISYKLVEMLTSNKVLQLFLSITLTFLGMCFVYLLVIILNFLMDKTRVRNMLVKKTFIFSSVMGGVILGATIYYGIYRNVTASAVIGGGLCVVGMLVQYKNRGKQIQFKTYNDLMRMKLPETLTEPQPEIQTEKV